MKLKAGLAVSAVALLAACGGGGGSVSNVPVQISPERVFSDGAGVARGVALDGDTVLVMISDVGGFVNYVQTTGLDASTNGLSPSSYSIVQILPTNANLRQGAINSGPLVGNVTIVEDSGGRAFNAVVEFPGQEIMVYTRGTAFGTAPTGTFTYNGTLVTGIRSLNPQIEYGSFALVANFSNQTFAISGANNFDTLNGSGTINTTSGVLASNSLTMTTSGTNRTASLYGNLHGNAAESVSGMFHSNEASPVYAGTFVGSR